MDGLHTRHSVRRIALASQLRAVSWIALLVMIPVVFYFTTEGGWDLRKQRLEGGYGGRFFIAQAEAMARGRLNVRRADIPSECFDARSQCFGYFGITPSLLRLPILRVLHWFQSALTPLYLGVAVLLAYWGALRLLARSLVESAELEKSRALVLGYAVAGAIALGPGGALLFLTRPAVYEEAAAWGVAFFVLTLDRVWAWHRSREPRTLMVAVLFGIAAANARPTAATACAVLGFVVALLSRFNHVPVSVESRTPSVEAQSSVRPRGAGWRGLIGATCLALLPGLTVAGVFMLKFRTPMPDLRLNEQIPETPWWRDILRINGERTSGFIFTPTELVAYFRPDSVSIRPDWPFFDFRFPRERILWVPPLPPGGAYVEPVASLTSTMPLPWALNLTVTTWLAITAWRLAVPPERRPTQSHVPMLTWEEWIFAAGSLAAAAAMAILTLTTFGITNRYLGDFFATSVVGVALGHRVMIPLLRGRPILTATTVLIGLLLVGWSVVVTLALNTRLVFG